MTDASPEVLPTEVTTNRVRLRPWRAEDAQSLLPVLEANRSHLLAWVPAHVVEPAPVPVLSERLAGFAADFAANRNWRFGAFAQDGRVLGEVGLFPRAAAGRVEFGESDRVELGYWLRADETGRGLVTEAARAVLAVAASVPRFTRVEIRCDERNAPSSGVPRRLGFQLETTITNASLTPEQSPVRMQVWTARFTDIRGLPPRDGGSAFSSGHPREGQMATWREKVDELVNDLQRERDELRVKAALGKAELRDELAELDTKLDDLKAKAAVWADKADDQIDDAMDEAKVRTSGWMKDLKEGYQKLRDRMDRDTPPA